MIHMTVLDGTQIIQAIQMSDFYWFTCELQSLEETAEVSCRADGSTSLKFDSSEAEKEDKTWWYQAPLCTVVKRHGDIRLLTAHFWKQHLATKDPKHCGREKRKKNLCWRLWVLVFLHVFFKCPSRYWWGRTYVFLTLWKYQGRRDGTQEQRAKMVTLQIYVFLQLIFNQSLFTAVFPV